MIWPRHGHRVIAVGDADDAGKNGNSLARGAISLVILQATPKPVHPRVSGEHFRPFCLRYHVQRFIAENALVDEADEAIQLQQEVL